MKHLLWVVGLISLALGAYFLYQYTRDTSGDKSDLVYGGIFFGISLILWAVFFFRKFREEGEQDISITKF